MVKILCFHCKGEGRGLIPCQGTRNWLKKKSLPLYFQTNLFISSKAIDFCI